jgi:hypothetical protein
MALEARSLREDLEAVDRSLEGLDWGLRRRVRLLLGHVTAQRIALHGSSGTLAVGVAKLSSAARVDIAMVPPPGDDPWHDLVNSHIDHLAVRWGLDRRTPGGAWFELGPEPETT